MQVGETPQLAGGSGAHRGKRACHKNISESNRETSVYNTGKVLAGGRGARGGQRACQKKNEKLILKSVSVVGRTY